MTGIALIFAAALLIVIIWAVTTRDRIKMLEIKIDEAKAGIDTALVKRYDILTESLNVAKGFAAHENALMVQLAQARTGMNLQKMQDVIENQEKVISSLKAVAEAYPQLGSNELFKELQEQIALTNEHIGAAKRVLNSNIALYNQKIAAFPACVIAGMIGCRPVEFFKETDEKKKQDVHMTF